jgi:hypothetical protein
MPSVATAAARPSAAATADIVFAEISSIRAAPAKLTLADWYLCKNLAGICKNLAGIWRELARICKNLAGICKNLPESFSFHEQRGCARAILKLLLENMTLIIT